MVTQLNAAKAIKAPKAAKATKVPNATKHENFSASHIEGVTKKVNALKKLLDALGINKAIRSRILSYLVVLVQTIVLSVVPAVSAAIGQISDHKKPANQVQPHRSENFTFSQPKAMTAFHMK